MASYKLGAYLLGQLPKVYSIHCPDSALLHASTRCLYGVWQTLTCQASPPDPPSLGEKRLICWGTAHTNLKEPQARGGLLVGDL
jgi:hypothetical protein